MTKCIVDDTDVEACSDDGRDDDDDVVGVQKVE